MSEMDRRPPAPLIAGDSRSRQGEYRLASSDRTPCRSHLIRLVLQRSLCLDPVDGSDGNPSGLRVHFLGDLAEDRVAHLAQVPLALEVEMIVGDIEAEEVRRHDGRAVPCALDDLGGRLLS